jgi:hypothetical protein
MPASVPEYCSSPNLSRSEIVALVAEQPVFDHVDFLMAWPRNP